ncbi:MAG: sensor domain-containing diguanylate cyclase [Gammaproteobacteria bacterium]
MDPIEITYSLPFLSVSIIAAILSSYVALELASATGSSSRYGLFNKWLAIGAVALGLGIWTMHFIGMFALQLPITLQFEATATLLSLVIAIVASFIGFSFVYLLNGLRWVLLGGIIMGLGIAGMHFLGMHGMRLNAQMHYDVTLTALSIVIAIVVASVALWILFKMKQGDFASRTSTKIFTACVMGAAISSMHYTGMAAITFIPNDAMAMSTEEFLIAGDLMIATLSIAAIMLIIFPLYSIGHENRFSFRIASELAILRINEARLRSLIENAPDAFFVYNKEGRFLDVNKVACTQLGYDREELLQKSIFDIEELIDEEKVFWPTLAAGEGCTLQSIHVRKDGTKFPVEINITGIIANGARQMFALARDITETEKLKAHLSKMAMTDELTGLYNRRAFMLSLEKELAASKRNKKDLAVLTLDIDYFKKVNDTYGHHTGDLALKYFAKIASETIRGEDTLGRIGGEEFAILLPNANREAACCLAERMRRTIAQSSFIHDKHTIAFTVSIGISTFDDIDTNPTTLLNNADIALYNAKGAGRNRVEVYKA